MKITILEHIGDTGNWEWYNIFRDEVFTPEQAIKQYIEDMHEGTGEQPEPENIQEKIGEDGTYFYAEHTNVRAMSYEI